MNIDENDDADDGIVQQSAPFSFGRSAESRVGEGAGASPDVKAKSASFSLFGGLTMGAANDEAVEFKPTSSVIMTSSPKVTASVGTQSGVSKSKAKRRASASTSQATLPLLLPAGSTLDGDCRAIIDELEQWDTEKTKLENEIAEAELQLLRKNRKLHSLKLKRGYSKGATSIKTNLANAAK
jgi:hypothetical protein